MPDNTDLDLPLSTLLPRLRVSQLRGLIAVMIAVVLGAVALGAWGQSAHDDDKIMEKNQALSKATSKYDQLKRDTDNQINQLNGKLAEANQEFGEAAQAIKVAGQNLQAMKSKADFLERFLTYKTAPSDVSRKLFIDHVCALWKSSQEHSVKIERRPLSISPDDIRHGLSPELTALLIKKGVPEIFFQNAVASAPQTFPFPALPRVSPTPDEAVATIQKYSGQIELAKVIHFFDGTNYQVPPEIALAVHTDPRCSLI